MKEIANYIISRLRVAALVLAVIVSAAVACGESVITFPRDRSASVAVVVRDLATGTDLVSQNPHKAMLPASTMKCFTTAAAMEAGLDTLRFRSHASIQGHISPDSILHGNLVIRGNGDPTIDSPRFPANPSFLNQIAEAVRQRGIREIEGEILVDSYGFPDNGPCDRWEVSDLNYEYGAGLYSLNYRNNANGSRAMKSPEETFVDSLDNRLMSFGIATGWDETDSADLPLQEICTHQSPLGSDIMHDLMVRSDNLFAEGILRFIAPGETREKAIARERSLLAGKGVDLDATEIYDGSGLARVNRVTADALASLLEKMAGKEGRGCRYSDLFPRVGKEGTVKNLLEATPLTGQLALKSGSMNGVHCYAGYKLDGDGRPTHAVVILVNDFICPRSQVKAAIESFLKKTF